jgi:hypothetical protein
MFSEQETEQANRLWMVIEEVELSFAYSLAPKLYFTLVNKQIGNRREKRMVMDSAFVTTLLSFRKLADFFFDANARTDDLKAAQFGFRCQPPLDKAQMDELSKYMAHFTTKGLGLQQRGFPFGVLGAAIYTRCLEFFDFLESNCLDRRVLADRQMLTRLKSIRRFIFAAGLLKSPNK